MARRTAGLDLLLALALGVEMQVEMLFVDAPRGDLLIARAALLALAGALAVRRRAPVIAVAVAFAVLTVLERLGGPVDANLVGPFFAPLFLCFSLGAHAKGRQFHAGLAVLVVATRITIRLDHPPGGLGTSSSRRRSSSAARSCSGDSCAHARSSTRRCREGGGR